MATHKLKTGDTAPDFELLDQDGQPVRLRDLLQKGPLVLYFYPHDETPGCTAQACSFRDQFAVFSDVGAQVVGVSVDTPEQHKAFAAHHRLPFTLLSDVGERVHEAYGVEKVWGLLRGRVTFVIDTQGIVRHVFSSQLRPTAHIEAALKTVRGLGAATGDGA